MRLKLLALDDAILDRVAQPVADRFEILTGWSCFRLAAHCFLLSTAFYVIATLLMVSDNLREGDLYGASLIFGIGATMGALSIKVWRQDYNEAMKMDEAAWAAGTANPNRLRRRSLRIGLLINLPLTKATALALGMSFFGDKASELLVLATLPLYLVGLYMLACQTGARRRITQGGKALAGAGL